MNLRSRILYRSFAMARPNSSSSSKNSKAELNFKETNETSDPYDLIDRNISGVEHRLRLRELRRLKEQLFLDKFDLNSLKNLNLSFKSNEINSSKFNFEISYSALSFFPGVNFATEVCLDPSVTIRLNFEASKFSKSEIKNIKKLMNLNEDSKEFTITISDFPFVSQNKNRAIDVLKAIIYVAKSENATEKNLDSLITFNSKQKPSSHKQLLEFPSEWLQGIHKKNILNE